MKNIALYLLIYNFTLLMILRTDWYSEIVTFCGYTTERYNVIDLLDTPFYILMFITIMYYSFWNKLNKLTLFQKQCFAFSFFYLGFKLLNFYLDCNYQTFMMWNLIIIFMPFVLLIDRKINR